MRERRAQVLLLAWLLAAALLSCARIRPPSGGAPDTTAPLLSGGRPAEGSRGSCPLSEVLLRFSEPVDRASVLEALRSEPPRLLRSVRWSGDTLLAVRFWEPLPAATSVDLYLVPGWRDRHRVPQPAWQVLSFATGDSLLPGWLAGEVLFKGQASRGLHLALSDSSGGFRRLARPDARGGFVFRGLPADGRAWLLAGYQDTNGDSLFDPALDFADTLRDSLRLTPLQPRRFGLRLDIIDPHEPGEVSGQFSCGDTLAGVYFLRLLPDSFRLADGSRPLVDPGGLPAAERARLAALVARPAGATGLPAGWLRLAKAGTFKLAGVPPGDAWLFVHKDLGTADTLWDPATEPAGLSAGPLRLPPGGSLSWPRFSFPLPTPAGGGTGPAPPPGEGP
jgi:hypothetical protein